MQRTKHWGCDVGTLTPEILREVLDSHARWLSTGQGARANLCDANLRGADLRGANLCGANLCGANLCDADLRGANLCGANLCGANLCGANLCGANLCDANLRGANLRGANLCGANLCGANLCDAYLCGAGGNMQQIKSVQCDRWRVAYTHTHMAIGCQQHTLSEWWGFTDEKIASMDSEALTWWRVWKPILSQIIEASPAVPYAEKVEDLAEVTNE
jgi:hypothetical protein